jgi:hypothetical protein
MRDWVGVGGRRLQRVTKLGGVNDLHFSSNVVNMIRARMRWAGHVVGTCGGKDICTQVLAGKPEGKVTWKTKAQMEAWNKKNERG